MQSHTHTRTDTVNITSDTVTVGDVIPQMDIQHLTMANYLPTSEKIKVLCALMT